jgi:hypothetical protein
VYQCLTALWSFEQGGQGQAKGLDGCCRSAILDEDRSGTRRKQRNPGAPAQQQTERFIMAALLR